MRVVEDFGADGMELSVDAISDMVYGWLEVSAVVNYKVDIVQ